MYDVMLCMPLRLLACGGGSVRFVVCGWKWCYYYNPDIRFGVVD